MEKALIYLVSLSVGTLLGDAFIHLIPEAYEKIENKNHVPIFILSGILLFFILEKFVRWRHCHEVACDDHPHPFSYLILAGDSVHNFIDGIIIGASFMASLPLGIATTMAVIIHEIPQEIGDFGSLVYGGFTKTKALFFNFLTALSAILGAILVLLVGNQFSVLSNFFIPFAAGGFIYVASADLLPEIHKHNGGWKSIGQLFFLVLGVMIMLGLLLIE